MSEDTLTVKGATAPRKTSVLDNQVGSAVDTADYDDADIATPVAEDSLKVLQALTQELFNRQRDVETKTLALAEAVVGLAQIQEDRLPGLMERYNLLKFDFVDATTGQQHTIKLENKWQVSMPGDKPEHFDKRKNIFAWLRSVGSGSVIKKNILVPVGLVTDEVAERMVTEIKATYPNFDPGLSEKVEPATLTALVSRLKDDGKNVCEDINVKPLRRAVAKAGGKKRSS